MTHFVLITIPKGVKITNYRTMTRDKKGQAVNGNKNVQYEWMIEEVNEFYEAIALCDRDEVLELLKEWKRVLVAKGTLRIAVPDFFQISGFRHLDHDLTR